MSPRLARLLFILVCLAIWVWAATLGTGASAVSATAGKAAGDTAIVLATPPSCPVGGTPGGRGAVHIAGVDSPPVALHQPGWIDSAYAY